MLYSAIPAKIPQNIIVHGFMISLCDSGEDPVQGSIEQTIVIHYAIVPESHNSIAFFSM